MQRVRCPVSLDLCHLDIAVLRLLPFLDTVLRSREVFNEMLTENSMEKPVGQPRDREGLD